MNLERRHAIFGKFILLKLYIMKKISTLILAIGATFMLLPSCKKNNDLKPTSQPAVSQSTDQNQVIALGKTTAQPIHDQYGPGAVYEIELSANASGPQGGGLWIWIGLYPNWQGDYAGADCGHGGQGAASDKGDVSWQYNATEDSLVIKGVLLNGLGAFPTTITVPSTYGHYTGTLGTFLTLPPFIPSFIGNSQLQVAP